MESMRKMSAWAKKGLRKNPKDDHYATRADTAKKALDDKKYSALAAAWFLRLGNTRREDSKFHLRKWMNDNRNKPELGWQTPFQVLNLIAQTHPHTWSKLREKHKGKEATIFLESKNNADIGYNAYMKYKEDLRQRTAKEVKNGFERLNGSLSRSASHRSRVSNSRKPKSMTVSQKKQYEEDLLKEGESITRSNYYSARSSMSPLKAQSLGNIRAKPIDYRKTMSLGGKKKRKKKCAIKRRKR